jgi:hypothetical protein
MYFFEFLEAQNRLHYQSLVAVVNGGNSAHGGCGAHEEEEKVALPYCGGSSNHCRYRGSSAIVA